MKKTLLIVSSVLLSIQAHANQLYGWVGGPGEGENYFYLKSNSSASGSLADIVSLTLLMPCTGETTYTPASIAMTLGSGFSWSPTQITAMSLSFKTPNVQQTGYQYRLEGWLAAGTLSVTEVDISPSGFIFDDPWVNDTAGSWLAFDSLADYQARLDTLGSSVPESGNSVLLLLGALAGLGVWRRV